MDIAVLKVLLSTMHQVGITQAVIEPDKEDENRTRIRASNKDKNILVYDTIDERLVDLPIGIQSVVGLLSRVQLFDEDKASITLRDNGKIVLDATVKQGRKKASFRFADPTKRDAVPVPAKIPGDLSLSNCLEMSDEYVKYLSSAIQAMSHTGNKAERTISFTKGDDENLILKVSDGEDDSFIETLEGTEEVVLDSVATWEVTGFERLLKAARETNKEKVAKFGINDYHVAVFDLGVLNVLVSPMG